MWNRNSTVQQRTHELHHHISLIVAIYATNPNHPAISKHLRTLDSMSPTIGQRMRDAITYGDHGGPLQLMLTLRDRDENTLTGAWDTRGEEAA